MVFSVRSVHLVITKSTLPRRSAMCALRDITVQLQLKLWFVLKERSVHKAVQTHSFAKTCLNMTTQRRYSLLLSRNYAHKEWSPWWLNELFPPYSTVFLGQYLLSWPCSFVSVSDTHTHTHHTHCHSPLHFDLSLIFCISSYSIGAHGDRPGNLLPHLVSLHYEWVLSEPGRVLCVHSIA